MKYLFILGRNVKLSVAEVLAYLKKTGNSVKDYSLNRNALIVDVIESIEAGAVEDLGGVISIGIVIQESKNAKGLIKEMEKKEIYLGESNKINYVIWEYCEDAEEIRNYLKKRFKSEKLKATEKKFTGSVKSQEGDRLENVGSRLINEQFFVFEIPAKEIYFGKIVQSCDYSKIEKRDMEKPVRRESLAISPRLAKIMINLSEVPEEGKLLDSFCGIGVILQEALLQELDVVGIDKDKEAVKGARKNLEWFNFGREKYKLFNDDSGKFELRDFVDVLVSEPDLGLTLRKVPSQEKAKIQLRKFEDLMILVLNNLKAKVRGRIVFSSPLVRTMNGRKGCNIERILEKTGLKLIEGFPIDEFRESQIVGRRIFVLEK